MLVIVVHETIYWSVKLKLKLQYITNLMLLLLLLRGKCIVGWVKPASVGSRVAVDVDDDVVRAREVDTAFH